ncbi:LOW QUALITY PROTEIN: hypothetical protein U9M48_022500 [Paspalum notatum var. saurae]|uniref:RNase H type-1 domain-containing protein n=1 Tax=Paspalum notatum var. saurae TaxID=547442 RepID=A0AAQ3TK01_PASNO
MGLFGESGMVHTFKFGQILGFLTVTPRGHTVISKVSDLIDPGTGNWDRDLVQDIFWEVDAKHILSIPLSRNTEDLLAWHFDEKGLFSVKSAYHVLHDKERRNQGRQEGGTSRAGGGSCSDWKKIWSLNCQPKIKQFVWRLAKNSLPWRRSIVRRGMQIDTRCPMCWRFDEDGGHCFLKCKWVKHCWRDMNLEGVRLRLTEAGNAAQMMQLILSLDEEEKMKTISLLYAWWAARNKANVGEQKDTTNEIVYRANMMLTDGSGRCSKGQVRSPNRKQNWSCPPDGILKLNCDAGFLQNEKSGSWGFVVRDSDGHGVLAGMGRLHNVPDVLCAEGYACLNALQAAREYGVSSLQLELDSLLLEKCLKTGEYDRSQGGGLFHEIRELIRLYFNSVEIVHVPRSCNRCAHELAKLSMRWDPDHSRVWSDPLPEPVNSLALGDLTDCTDE